MGSTIKFNYKVDSDLIGGFKLQLGSFMIDTSIKNKLKKYEKKMLENERKRKAALAAAAGYSGGGKIKMDAQYKSAGGTIFKGR